MIEPAALGAWAASVQGPGRPAAPRARRGDHLCERRRHSRLRPAAGRGTRRLFGSPLARAYIEEPTRARSALPLGLANALLGVGDRAVALVLPKTCPQACAHHSGDTRFHSFAGSFDCPGRGHLVEPLRFREVLDRTRSEGALQGLPTRGRPFPGRALLSSEVRRNPQNGLFCRYLSPLPDSNRGPPPYHGTAHANGGNPRQRFALVSAV
jgi:hypothetical protein